MPGALPLSSPVESWVKRGVPPVGQSCATESHLCPLLRLCSSHVGMAGHAESPDVVHAALSSSRVDWGHMISMPRVAFEGRCNEPLEPLARQLWPHACQSFLPARRKCFSVSGVSGVSLQRWMHKRVLQKNGRAILPLVKRYVAKRFTNCPAVHAAHLAHSTVLPANFATDPCYARAHTHLSHTRSASVIGESHARDAQIAS